MSKYIHAGDTIHLDPLYYKIFEPTIYLGKNCLKTGGGFLEQNEFTLIIASGVGVLKYSYLYRFAMGEWQNIVYELIETNLE